jgi:hypothetical protein
MIEIRVRCDNGVVEAKQEKNGTVTAADLACLVAELELIRFSLLEEYDSIIQLRVQK